MAMVSLIWSCCDISNGILTTSGAENTKKDTEPIAIQISSNRFLRSCVTTTEMELLQKLPQSEDSRVQERVWDWQSRTMIAMDISICLLPTTRWSSFCTTTREMERLKRWGCHPKLPWILTVEPTQVWEWISRTMTMMAGRILLLLTWQISDMPCIETTVMAHSHMRARLRESARCRWHTRGGAFGSWTTTMTAGQIC